MKCQKKITKCLWTGSRKLYLKLATIINSLHTIFMYASSKIHLLFFSNVKNYTILFNVCVNIQDGKIVSTNI